MVTEEQLLEEPVEKLSEAIALASSIPAPQGSPRCWADCPVNPDPISALFNDEHLIIDINDPSQMSETSVIPTTVIQADERYLVALEAKVDGICGKPTRSEILRFFKVECSSGTHSNSKGACSNISASCSNLYKVYCF